MGVADKVWDALTTVIKMNGKVVSLATVVKEQQAKIESLTERVVRLEAQLETMFKIASMKGDAKRLTR